LKKGHLSASAVRRLKKKISRFPRQPLIQGPTPVQKMSKLTALWAGPEIWMKREDLTGLAFGGNKSRKMEYILADILGQKADTVITWASLQSNWCLQMSAAARMFGVEPILILFKTHDLSEESDGNLLLDRLLGAEVRIHEAARGKSVSLETGLSHLEAVAEEVRGRGRKPYLVPVGGSMPAGSMSLPLGALSYVRALVELVEQTDALGLQVGAVVHATGSGGTQAGLVVGAKALGLETRVIGISVSEEKTSFGRLVLDICRRTEEALGLEQVVSPEDVIVLDDYLGEGYGIVDRAVARTLSEVFKAEGIVLDPVYTAKAMVGLQDLARKGFFRPDKAVVFFHTGGTPALFPNRRRLLELL
jgi:L-cysteate sulfo-lyase